MAMSDEELKIYNKIRSKLYHENNRDKISDRKRRYYKRDPIRVCKDKKLYRIRIKEKLYKILGGDFCKRCGFTDKRALQFDHINGGGRMDHRKHKNSTQMYLFYVNNEILAKQTLQVLCANCNWIKKHENNELHRPKKHIS